MYTQVQVIKCRMCESTNQRRFIAEMGIRSGGLKNIKQPVVWVFPQLTICLDCGNAVFNVPDAELRALAQDNAAAAIAG
jgi:hypothetical protein